jgi:hypothetical protein
MRVPSLAVRKQKIGYTGRRLGIADLKAFEANLRYRRRSWECSDPDPFPRVRTRCIVWATVEAAQTWHSSPSRVSECQVAPRSQRLRHTSDRHCRRCAAFVANVSRRWLFRRRRHRRHRGPRSRRSHPTAATDNASRHAPRPPECEHRTTASVMRHGGPHMGAEETLFMELVLSGRRRGRTRATKGTQQAGGRQ